MFPEILNISFHFYSRFVEVLKTQFTIHNAPIFAVTECKALCLQGLEFVEKVILLCKFNARNYLIVTNL